MGRHGCIIGVNRIRTVAELAGGMHFAATLVHAYSLP
ncbi:hypothetical protein DJ62_2922 [Yersinia enterocolitica]|nr:hypothetical protein DJ62_2922 [Yersinia enterocolitica]